LPLKNIIVLKVMGFEEHVSAISSQLRSSKYLTPIAYG
jgi:hypothetical protein